jgi:hypothetical protein
MKNSFSIITITCCIIFTLVSLIINGQQSYYFTKRPDIYYVDISLSNISEGTILKKNLIEDPIFRFINNPNNIYTIKSFRLRLRINEKNYYYEKIVDNTLTKEQINIIKSSGIQYDNYIIIDLIIGEDKEGNEYKLGSLILHIL